MRTQIYLPDYKYRMLREKARSADKTFAQTVRELLDLGLEKEKEKVKFLKKRKKLSAGEFLLTLAKKGEELGVDAGSDASVTIDETVYGFKR